MVERVDAYRTTSGAIFSTRHEAEKAEVSEAVRRIAALVKDDKLLGLVSGNMNEECEDALRFLASIIPPRAGRAG